MAPIHRGDMTNSAQFLNAFSAIEAYLRKIARLDQRSFVSFSTVLDQVAQSSAPVRRYRDQLRRLADLRNAIAHNGLAIAEPHDTVIKELEQIKTALMNPARVMPIFGKTVYSVGKQDPLVHALKFFGTRNFSQVPVKSGKEVIGLLTTNTAARWLAASAPAEVLDLREYTVGDLLQHAEYEKSWNFVRQDAQLVDVLALFDQSENAGRRLDAVLITAAGKPTEELLGIITLSDIPKLLRKLGVQ